MHGAPRPFDPPSASAHGQRGPFGVEAHHAGAAQFLERENGIHRAGVQLAHGLAGCQVPLLHRRLAVAGDERFAVGMIKDGINLDAACHKLALFLAVAARPNADLAVRPAGRHAGAVRTNGQRSQPAVVRVRDAPKRFRRGLGERPARQPAPRVASQQALAVRMKRQRRHPTIVPGQRRQRFEIDRRGIQAAHRCVLPAGDENLAVVTEARHTHLPVELDDLDLFRWSGFLGGVHDSTSLIGFMSSCAIGSGWRPL